jgi:hypothetical protein
MSDSPVSSIADSAIKASIRATNDAMKAFLDVFRQAGARAELREAERELLQKNPDLSKVREIIGEAKRLEGSSSDVRRVEAMHRHAAKHGRSKTAAANQKGSNKKPSRAAARKGAHRTAKKQTATVRKATTQSTGASTRSGGRR